MPVKSQSISIYHVKGWARAFTDSVFDNISKPISCLFLCALVSFANQVEASAVHQGVSVFSTYPSEGLLNSCSAQHALPQQEQALKNTAEICMEDAISPDSFIEELSNSGQFYDLIPNGEGTDYELLIANVGASPNKHQRHAKQFAEFTLQWRGIEIDSSTFDIDALINDSEQRGNQNTKNEAFLLVSRWLEHVNQARIFTSQFLFDALEASNYDLGLQVPETIGDFTKLDTQLFADPFSGVITRYTHSEFEDALIDVIVYPFIAPLSLKEAELLPNQLKNDLQKASANAALQNLTLSQVSPASPYTVNNKISGWRLGLSAASETSPTIFATTYVFKQQDKIVKISTTFPPDFSDTIVNELIVNVEVPQESVMMKKIRELL